MHHTAPTRGQGLLERFLARQRAAMADRLIPAQLRSGCILDIGCGSYPYFLVETRFSRKIGVDRLVDEDYTRLFASHDLELIGHDIERDESLPLRDSSCHAVTMLATFEHIEPHMGMNLIREIHRVLRPGGVLVMTTPAAWTDKLLWFMSRVGLVSVHEVEEHKASYSRHAIERLLGSVFPAQNIVSGHFELRMNVWAVATKPADPQVPSGTPRTAMKTNQLN
ncbi:MAG: class I SAM-dependent methyltransferase [Thermodesulfobacteriota bacterium]